MFSLIGYHFHHGLKILVYCKFNRGKVNKVSHEIFYYFYLSFGFLEK
jgi:hypothetical protein